MTPHAIVAGNDGLLTDGSWRTVVAEFLFRHVAMKILLLGPAWIGDMVMAESLVANLQRKDSGARVDFLVPPWTAPLGERMGGISATHRLESVHGRFGLPMRIRAGWKLRREGYDLAIILPNTLKSAIAPFVARIPVRRGYLGEMRYGLVNDIRHLDKVKLPRTIDRFVALGADKGDEIPVVGPPVLRYDAEARRSIADRLGLSGETRSIIALCPGAEYGPAKQWPAAHFGALARRMIDRGSAVWIFGSAKDRAVAAEITELASAGDPASAPINLCGETSLLQAVDLLSLSTAVVTNDSGLMHVAAAVGRPIVALYGSTTPAMTPPLGDRVRIIERTLSCRPCFQRTCPLDHLNCLRTIAPDEVEEAVLAVMQDSAEPYDPPATPQAPTY
jgi:heptosyltransferase-2